MSPPSSVDSAKAAAAKAVDPRPVLWGLAVLLAAAAYPFALSRPIQFRDRFFEAGTVLMHLVPRLTVVTYQMPVPSVLSVASTVWIPPQWGAYLFVTAALALVFLLGALLDSAPAGLLAAAVTLGMALARPAAAGDNPLGRPDESLCFSLFAALAAAFLLRRAKTPSGGWNAALAAAIGASLACRSVLVLFPALLCLLDRKTRRRDLLILFAAPFLFLLPWAGFNLATQGKFLFTENGGMKEDILFGACGSINCPGISIPELAVRAGLNDGSSLAAVLFFTAKRTLAHPLLIAEGFAHRLYAVFMYHPLLALGALASLLLYRKERTFQALAAFFSYFLLLHCLMCLEIYYFYALWLVAAPAACVPVARLLSLKERFALSAAAQDRLERGLLIGGLGLALAACALTWSVLGRYVVRAPRALWVPEQEAAAVDQALQASPNNAWLLRERGRFRLLSGDDAGAVRDFFGAFKQVPDPSHELDLYWALARDGWSAPLHKFQPGREDDYFWQEQRRLLYYNALLEISKGHDAAGLAWVRKASDQGWDAELRGDFLRQLGWALKGRSPRRKQDLLASLERISDVGSHLRTPEGEAIVRSILAS